MKTKIKEGIVDKIIKERQQISIEIMNMSTEELIKYYKSASKKFRETQHSISVVSN